MPALLMTGFPGFLGSALVGRLLARRPHSHAVCVVQDRHLGRAATRLAEIEQAQPHTAGRIRIVQADITEPGLGISPHDRPLLRDVREVWHLAAIYDLAVGAELARKVNVDGTSHVIEFCRSRHDFHRLHHVSTCYVSGRYAGEFPEDGLELGQSFRNHYEATKYDAERRVREAMADGLPATIYRPGIVVGDSTTGETQKFDGPYFLADFLRRQVGIAVVPRVGDPDRVRFSLVPRDFVLDAMDALSVHDRSEGRTYALTDPHPPTVRELVDAFARRLDRRVLWLPLPGRLTRAAVALPGVERLLGIPAESVDYFASPTTYSTTNSTRDLADTGVTCPPFPSYAERLLDYMLQHPEIDSAAMV